LHRINTRSSLRRNEQEEITGDRIELRSLMVL
jgi:hypothetical protein